MASSSTLSQGIAASLRNDILCGHYVPAQRLPSERDLSAQFGASRGAVREALSQLEQVGLIHTQPGGARVKAVQDATIAVLGPLMELNEYPDPGLVDHFLQTFGALSAMNARFGIANANSDQINHLQDLLVEMANSERTLVSFQSNLKALLDALMDISDNLVVRLIGNDLRGQFAGQISRLEIEPELDARRITRFINEFKQSLKSRSGDQAAQAFQQLFDDLREALIAALEQKIAKDNQMKYQASGVSA